MKTNPVSVMLLCSLIFAFGRVASAQDQAQTPTPPAASPAAGTTVPRLVSFGGVMKDAAGKPATGPISVTFSLYAEQEGGNPLWSEAQMVQADAQGHYSVFLGATEPTGLPLDLFTTGTARWLAVQSAVSGELPRVLLVGVPYALKAADADTLGGKPASAFVTTDSSSSQRNTNAVAGTQVLAASTIMPAATLAALSGTGTTDFIPIWTNSTTLGNSTIFETGGRVGIGTTSPISTLDVNGQLSLPAKGTATSSTGFNSQPLDFFASVYNSGISAAVTQHFRWEAEPVSNDTSSPSGKFDLLFASGTATPAETGLSISSNGIITFASGQTLPTVSGNEMVNGELTVTNSNGEAGNFTSTQGGATGLTATGGGPGANQNGGAGIQAIGGEGNGAGGAGIVAGGGRGGEAAGGDGVDAQGGTGADGGVGVKGTGGSGDASGPPGVLGIGGDGPYRDGGGVLAVGGSKDVACCGVTPGDGIDATSGGSGAFAGSFTGDVTISGNLSVSGTKNFRIDHPLDPANRYLYHASVESSEVLNLYSGNVTLDASGGATVQLPEWFGALNKDFRYQLTAIGGAAPGLYIAQEIQHNGFRIAGGNAGLKVSWQVAGVRQDAWEKAHPMVVEVDKPKNERGYYLNPDLFGAPGEKGMDWARNPQLMQRIKAEQAKRVKLAQARKHKGQ